MNPPPPVQGLIRLSWNKIFRSQQHNHIYFSLNSPTPTTNNKEQQQLLSDSNLNGLLTSLCFRPYAHHRDPRHPIDYYPRGFIDQLHHEDTNSRSMFSPSFVDHMRIPRAMEVKIIESVNSLNNTHPRPPYSPPCLSPTHDSHEDYLSADMFSIPKDRMPPSRQQSFRYSNMSTEESNERILREKMLVSELRQKLQNQSKIAE